MKRTGYVIFIISLLVFLCASLAFGFLFFTFLNLQDKGVAAQEFLESEPQDIYVNSTLEELLAEGMTVDERTDFGISERYVSPEGIEFISKSKQWDSSELELLYKELLRNKHGEELYSLSSVVIYPQADESAAATHKNYSQLCTLPISHTLLPKDFSLEFFRNSGQISLYDGDRITTVEGMADSLSHEYGHHYTCYHMLTVNGEALYDTEYAALRGLNAENSFTDREDENFYLENHYKYLLEIAAEDYVALMGSPASRETAEYKDIMETLYLDSYSWKHTRSSSVQENLTIPMACEIEGLSEYFYSFIEEEAPEYNVIKDMNIGVNKRTQSYNLVGGYKTFVYYEVSFDKVYGEDATYVVTVYDPDDFAGTLYPIRTVTNGEKPLCYIGNVVRNLGSSVVYNDDSVAKGTKVFVINVITADGDMYTSDPFSYSFGT